MFEERNFESTTSEGKFMTRTMHEEVEEREVMRGNKASRKITIKVNKDSDCFAGIERKLWKN